MITGDLTELGIGVSRLGIGGNAIGCGNDIPESAVEAMFQIATGGGLSSPPPTSVASGTTSIGGVSFREGTLPVVVNITDAISHHSGASACPGVTYTNARVAEVAADEATALRALEGICAQVVQIASDVSGSCNAYNDGVTYTTRLGGVVPPSAWDVLGRPPGCAAGLCCTGAAGAGVAPVAGVCPLTYVIPANGSGLSTAIANAVHVLALFAPFDVTAEWEGGAADEAGGALPAGTTSADFIDGATPLSFGTSPLTGTDPTLTETTFQGVVPGTDVTFTVSATNDFVEQTNTARTFLVAVRALAGACRTLDERTVYVLVPPAPPD
ncbi:MAG: hypothetical protein M5U28_16560 [Sandaracinaceae bacterium]|nr:hypothetical protein [Sandaracinaceae bacterium]